MIEDSSSDANNDDVVYTPNSVSKNVSQDDEALLKFGENQFLSSIDTIKNFSQAMITLDSGLFAVYFALLQFLGIKDIADLGIRIASFYVALPPILIILSLIAFIIAILPLFAKFSLSIPEEISRTREKVLRVKYCGAIGGVLFLISAMGLTIDILLKILRL